ncbi:MAG: aspartate aminotransferase family protein [Verrucomicrobia bacterium]|jgi:4-aminobutyrate aminotransferase|nr:aspartate aminotransferase family protein [Verrucomicrobiota bacterium]
MNNDHSDSLDHLRSEGDINLSPARQAWAQKTLSDATREKLEEDASVFLHQSLSTPCLNVLTGCQGVYLEDAQGKRILDFHGNNVHQVGFGHPKVIEAITRQMQNLSFCTRRYTNDVAIQLAQKLISLAPGDLNRVLFAPGGTSAIGMALKLARASTGRHKTISMWDSFHGASLDAISIGGESVFRSGIGPLLPGCEHVPPPDNKHCPFKCGTACNLSCADYVEYVLEKEGDVAAVVAETVRSTPFIPPADYWQRIRRACDKHGALLILDEIPHCLGRTGRMFTFEHYGIVPDMVVIGKGLGGGIFPLAALIAREGLNDAMPHKALGHYTHEKNPVACAAALAAIDVIESDGLLANATSMGNLAMGRMRNMASSFSMIGDVRGKGLLMGMELLKDKGTGERAINQAEAVMYAALTHGLNFKVTMGNILTLTPPLTITESEMNAALDILELSLREVSLSQD